MTRLLEEQSFQQRKQNQQSLSHEAVIKIKILNNHDAAAAAKSLQSLCPPAPGLAHAGSLASRWAPVHSRLSGSLKWPQVSQCLLSNNQQTPLGRGSGPGKTGTNLRSDRQLLFLMFTKICGNQGGDGYLLSGIAKFKRNKTCRVASVSPAAAAKSLQWCPTRCDPIDGSPRGSSVPGILQARVLQWVAISFS